MWVHMGSRVWEYKGMETRFTEVFVRVPWTGVYGLRIYAGPVRRCLAVKGHFPYWGLVGNIGIHYPKTLGPS